MAKLKHSILSSMTTLGLESFVRWYWSQKGQDVEHLRAQTLRERFEIVYKKGLWAGSRNQESLSGTGSSLGSTALVREQLACLLRDLDIRVLVDIGCGDLNWMRQLDLPCDYIGVDIVPEVIEANIKNYQDGRRSFVCMDASAAAPPNGDVFLCREVIFHLSFSHALALLRNVKQAGAKYLLATTDPTVRRNINIPSGAWRDVNLEIEPFALGPRIGGISDGEGDNPNRILGLWDLRELVLSGE